MTRGTGLFYLTYNGIYNFTNGIGTQTQLLLRGLERMQDELWSAFGRVVLHVVCPLPDQDTWGYDAAFLQQQQERIAALGGTLHLVPYKTESHQELWDLRSWHTLSQGAATLLPRYTAAYDKSLIICVDQPWLQTPCHLAAAASVKTLLVLYNTAFIRNWRTPDPQEIAWEQQGLAASRSDNGVYIADICPSFTAHLRQHFSLATASLAPYTSSILSEDDEFMLLPAAVVQEILRQYHIPLHKNLLLAFGRAAPVKGFEYIIPALAPLRERCHFVLISVPYGSHDPQQQLYDHLLTVHGLDATHIRHFTRELPQALCQWPRTKMVLMPSQQETFSNIVLEVALWARRHGPVVVASHVGGFVDQIVPGESGFFIDTAAPEVMTRTVQQVLDLPGEAHARIRRNAYQRVLQHYDFRRNFPTTLDMLVGGHNDSPDGVHCRASRQ